MQDKNHSKTNAPTPKDGTQQTRRPVNGSDANWYGSSQEPQEEFRNDVPSEQNPAPPSDDSWDDGRTSKSSEGTPTFLGVNDPREGHTSSVEDIGAVVPEK